MRRWTKWLLFVSIFVCWMHSTVIANSTQLYQNTFGVVVNIIDGESFLLKTADGTTAYVKLSGVNSKANQEAFRYLNDVVMGKRVKVVLDYTIPVAPPWNYAFVYVDDDLLNTRLLRNGLAVADNSIRGTSDYRTYYEYEQYAQKHGMGMWYTNEDDDKEGIHLNESVNINTATKSHLVNNLYGISNTVAQNIVDYQKNHPFQSISDIREVNGFTEDMYRENRYVMVTKTNINTASKAELLSLYTISSSEVNAIVNYREEFGFDDTRELYREGLISRSLYDVIKDYIMVK